MKRKEKVFVIFTDLDKTVTPLGLSGITDLLDIVKKIIEREKIIVKFCAISGRPADYVLGFMHTMRDIFAEAGLKDVFDFGAGEQGCLIVDGKNSYRQIFIGNPQNIGLKSNISEIIMRNPNHNKVVDEPGKRYTSSIHIKKEIKENMSKEDQQKIYDSIKNDIIKAYDDSVNIAMSHNCMEVMSKEISKANAIKWLINEYMKKYEIVGMTFSGDASNDFDAVNYMSKLAEIPGTQANVFLPGNAVPDLESDNVEAWKNKNHSASPKRILKGNTPYFKGVTDLMRTKLHEGKLISKGIQSWETKDDLALLRKELSEK